MRLIDADALKKSVEGLADCYNGYSDAYDKACIIGLIDEEPTVDAVEVVRCKECKFLSHFTDGHIECRLLHDHRPVPCTYVTMHENDFCSYGERREVTE